jgi:hypothetical protein
MGMHRCLASKTPSLQSLLEMLVQARESQEHEKVLPRRVEAPMIRWSSASFAEWKIVVSYKVLTP